MRVIYLPLIQTKMQEIEFNTDKVMKMIKRFRIDDGKNDYATIIDPEEHEDERKQLISEGYQPWSRYKIQAEENFGKIEELFVR